MKEHPNLFEIFSQEAPEVYTAYNGFIRSLIEIEGLDSKTKQLLYIAMKIASGDRTAVMLHIPMAKMAGASRDEIKVTVLLTITIIGLQGLEYLPDALKIYDTTVVDSSAGAA